MFVQVLWDTGGVVKLEPGPVGALGHQIPLNPRSKKISDVAADDLYQKIARNFACE